MKLEKIIEIKDKYKATILDNDTEPDYLLRICIKTWQDNFDIDLMHLAPILGKAMKNEVSGRLWGGENHSIKSGLIKLAEHNPDLFWTALKDLFNQDRMIIMKTNRFIHHCDMIFDDIKRKDDRAISHHQDYTSACLLLSLQYPSQYCQFNFEIFLKFCNDIGVLDLPVNTDLERYFKILHVVNKIIGRDESFMELYYSKLPTNVYLGPSLDIIFTMMEHNFQST